jgi:Kef-type K+ transport system membrane component KefB
MEPAPVSRSKTLAAYGVMLAAAGGLYLQIRSTGEALFAPSLGEALFAPSLGEAAPVGEAVSSHVLFHVLLALVVVIAASRLLGAAFKYLHQPPVIGEVIAGILLGPSLLGRISPDAQDFVLPPAIAPHLGIVAQVGVILFMFLVGLELDTSRLKQRSHATLAISHASIVLPFLLGSVLALFLYPLLCSEEVGFTNFSLFMGVSMSVTAFPVLARILTDRGLDRSKLGVVALACAAVDDVTAWCLLAVVVGIVRARASDSIYTLGLTLLYVAVMLAVVRPVVRRLVHRQEIVGKLSRGATAAVFIGLLLSALATEAIGIHALFGAFLLGAIIPHDSRLAQEIVRRLEDVVIVVLLPAFFAFTGMRTEIGLLEGGTDFLLCGAIVLVACAGKFGGSAIAARLSGLGWHESAALGVLMNTRGLMELIVLNVGLDLGVISPRLFAMLVVMAVVTTLMTTPALELLYRSKKLEGALAPVGPSR